jgi:hypothetical protein
LEKFQQQKQPECILLPEWQQDYVICITVLEHGDRTIR